jgi:hypothetical protein
MKNSLKTWAKALLTVAAVTALVDMWRNWPWAKRLASAFVKKNEDQA